MVKIMKNPIKMDDLGGFPIIFGNTHINIDDSPNCHEKNLLLKNAKLLCRGIRPQHQHGLFSAAWRRASFGKEKKHVFTPVD